MVDRRELITICRQIGTMMEVGVDFLLIARVLREQTENPRLLELYDGFEHDLRMGGTLADAMEGAPDVFSPFAVSLVRQGEARGDIEGAWHRLADFLKQEAQEDRDLGFESPSIEGQTPFASARRVPALAPLASPAPEQVAAIDERAWLDAARHVLSWGAMLALLWAALGATLALGYLAPRWTASAALLIAALWAGAAAQRLRSALSDAAISDIAPAASEANADDAYPFQL